MPTARWLSGAVHIPELGELVLGGSGKFKLEFRTAELLEIDEEGEIFWRKINHMIIPRVRPSAVYLDRSVFVASMEESSMEMLSLTAGLPGQWTLISEICTPSEFSCSMCVYEGRILLAGELNVNG